MRAVGQKPSFANATEQPFDWLLHRFIADFFHLPSNRLLWPNGGLPHDAPRFRAFSANYGYAIIIRFS